jgi:kynurenine formamidase/peptidoglycan/xylan/chitin deacetylase (PgdA/CDA1 family)
MKSNRILVGMLLVISLSLVATASSSAHKQPSLMEIYDIIKTKQFVDLTHSFEPGIPHWKGFPDEKLETLYWYDPGVGTLGSGFYAQYFSIVGQWGTHVDSPAHFIKGLRTVDQIDVKEMILPLVVIDVHEKVAKNPDYTITMEDVRTWEEKHGKIPKGAFVAMRTDWSKRWPDAVAMQNKDANGTAHYPGWSMEVLKYLYEDRKITASGHEPTDTDPGIATSKDDYSLETYILQQNHYQIELLTNLDRVPEAGALVVVAFPKPKNGSGFPARVFAILDSSDDKQSHNVLVNLQVDAENTGENLFKVLGELERRGYTTTVYVTGTFAENNGMTIQEIQEHGHDIAFHGWKTGENLTTMNYSMQQEILIKAKNSVENYSGQVEGFRPQYYSQNEDTYTILDSLNISYDSGFISGLKYIPGYENYTKPYKVTNHSFYAVPVSSYNTSIRTIYLCDLSATSKFKINATEWYSILRNKFDESEKKNEPMVVVLHPWITGNETTGYWQAFTQFLNYTDTKSLSEKYKNRIVEI